ncbi:MAG: hypothetical protein C4K47_07310 [Candidatus Thorarchaeota archaeon]|nr:MAG: hypothetical protein C4K47_07310 [Candidatus Thorarchaeota archaeon]
MSSSPRPSKFLFAAFVMTLVFGAATFGNLPGPVTSTGSQVVNGVVFNFADYPSLTHEQVAAFNYVRGLVNQPLERWDGWNIGSGVYYLVHYQLAFMSYAIERMFEVTSGYRTSYYSDVAYNLVKKMNTTEAEYTNASIESMEWTRPVIGYSNWTQYYYPDPIHPDANDVYTGGFRGPANIMWTGHYALMELLYERNFHNSTFYDEYSWYMQDWNNSLTTDGLGHPRASGIWECGLIPCQPYAIWVQCNTIPLYFTELYDNLHGTDWMETGMWDYGLNFIEANMTDQYGLYTDEYFVQEPMGFHQLGDGPVQEFPGKRLDPYVNDGRPLLEGYGVAWSLLFIEYTEPNVTAEDYPVFLEHYSKDISADQLCMIDTYHNPGKFDTYDMLCNLYAVALAQQMGDLVTRDRIANFIYSPYNKVWSADGRSMHWDTTAVEPFLQSSLAYGWLWATVPVSVKALADARPADFWNYPYISSADDDNIWIYQAQWDPIKQGFVLNVRVDKTATLTFSNFASEPTAYSGGYPLPPLTPVGGSDYALTLSPGTYQLVLTTGG